MAKVSIIMNCFNSDKYLKEAINSVYAQTYDDWEIIFWDNQSTDNSADIAKSYDKRLRYFYADEFLPLGASRNKALEKAQGEYIAFLDCDDTWLPVKLELQVAVFEQQPDTGFIYSNFYVLNNQTDKKTVGIDVIQPSGDIFIEQLSFSYSIAMMTVIFKSEPLAKMTEWFDKSLTIPEDFDFFLRLLRFTNAYYIHEPLAVYRMHESNTTKTKWAIYYDEMRYVTKKLIDLYRHDSDDIKSALYNFAIEIDITEAREHLSEGATSKASELLRKHKEISGRARAFYMLSKLPKPITKAVYKCYMGLRG